MFRKKLNLPWLVDFVLSIVHDVNKPVMHIVACCVEMNAYGTVGTNNSMSMSVKFIPPLGWSKL
jgi:hypothetical protein